MKVLVVSGFLGAGKTTFITELLRRTKVRAAVLENEYGDTDLDARTVKKAGPLQVLEFMEGCVCCTKKDSFANTVLAVSAGLDPEYLIVEPSGIARLGSIIENIRRVEYERIRLLKPVTVVCPRSMGEHLNDYPEIMTDQIENAGTILFTKCESEAEHVIKESADFIRTHNPDAEILAAPYRLQPDAWFHNLLREGDVASPQDVRHTDGFSPQPVSVKENDETSSLDILPEQLTVRKCALPSPGSVVCFLEDVLRGTYGHIIRVKGMISAGKDRLRIDLADGLYAVTGADTDTDDAEMVFIGERIEKRRLEEHLSSALATRIRPAYNG